MPFDEFSVSRADRHFEDYVAGRTYEYGPVSVTESEIIEFARAYDPQEMHLDPVKAAAGPTHGLIASGWQTVGIMMRLFVEHFVPERAGLPSPGVDELRWVRPVRPGDLLRIRVTITETRRSRSKPDRGLIRTEIAVVNQDDLLVLTMKPMNMARCREPASPAA